MNTKDKKPDRPSRGSREKNVLNAARAYSIQFRKPPTLAPVKGPTLAEIERKYGRIEQ